MSTAVLDDVGPFPWPANRNRWRIVLANRGYAGSTWQTDAITDMVNTRSVSLEQQLNQPAKFTFVLDGNDSEAALVKELEMEMLIWRWDDWGYSAQVAGINDVPMFRGPIIQSQDELSEQANTVTFTAFDYLAMLQRRLITQKYSVLQRDQDLIVGDLIDRAVNAWNTPHTTSFSPGSYLPIGASANRPGDIGPGDALNPRPASGQLRDRTYLGNEKIGEMLDNLAAVDKGFDYDIIPHAWRQAAGVDMVRVFYPQQGITRSNGPLLEYGDGVSSLSRAVSSANYANFIRVLGNNGSSDPAIAQLYSERWSSEANNVALAPVGLWQMTDDATDVTIQATLDAKAQGALALNALAPTYTLNLRPGWWKFGQLQMGDTVELRIRAGRLNVDTWVRIVGITYTVGDDGQEDISITVGQPRPSFADLFHRTTKGINALARR